MNAHDQQILHSSEESDWRTPPECFATLHQEFDFGLDGAADARSTHCLYWLGPESPYGEDALTVDLVAVGFDPHEYRIFLNPPFSRTKANAYRTGRIKQGSAWVAHPVDEAKARTYETESWAQWGWDWSQRGFTIVALLPFAPQTEWYREYVYGHAAHTNVMGEAIPTMAWSGHAAREERRLPHRISYLRPDGSPAANAGVNTAVIVWKPPCGIVGPWQPHSFYWSYR